jgi:AmmeMemoRadiSam system protein A
MLRASEREALARLARSAARRSLGLPGPAAPTPEGRLAERAGAVVTWLREGRPRGSAGSVVPVRGLADQVAESAVAALTADPRVAPASPRDLPKLRVEIAIPGPLEEVAPPAGIEIGLHGLAVEKGVRRAFLLPSAPLAWGWTAEQFLGQLCLKAGLPETAWREARDVTVYRFVAEVFGDSA